MDLLALPLKLLGAAPRYTLRWLQRRMVYGRKTIYLSIDAQSVRNVSQGTSWWNSLVAMHLSFDTCKPCQ